MTGIQDIIAPKLTSVNYGTDINELIQNIDGNFKKLANHDFIKGEKGDSLCIEKVDIASDETILNGLKDAISTMFVETPKNISGKGVMDHFNNPGNIYLIYEIIAGEKVLVSSLPYTFKDLRFHNMSDADTNEYDNEIDYSCVICYDQGKFTAMQIFPTIYYDQSLNTFCWTINGIKTGLEAQGPRGFEGKAGVFKMVIAELKTSEYQFDDGNPYVISKILNNGSWVSVLESGQEMDHASLCAANGVPAGTPVMVIVEQSQVATGRSATEDSRDNIIYLSESYEDADMGTGENQMLVKCGILNQIFDVHPITNVNGICDEIWDKMDEDLK